MLYLSLEGPVIGPFLPSSKNGWIYGIIGTSKKHYLFYNKSISFLILHIKNGGNSFQSSVEHGTIDWFKIGKGVRQAVYCHPVI